MAKAPKTTGAIAPPDFEKAKKVYHADVVPARKSQRAAMQEAGQAWKVIKKECRVHKGGYAAGMKVVEMEEAEQQAFLRAFKAALDDHKVTLHADMVDIANGADKNVPANVVNVGAKPETQLATIN